MPRRRYRTAVLALLVLTGSGCYAHLVPDADEEHEIEMGQTLAGVFKPMSDVRAKAFGGTLTNTHAYRFRARPGERVTVTVISQGPYVILGLKKGRYGALFAQDSNYTPSPDDTGPNGELIAKLPEGTHGEYTIELRSREPGPYTLTLKRGVAPTLSLWKVPKPISGSAGKFMCPFTDDNTVTAWVEKGRGVAVAGNLGGAVGSVAGETLKQGFLPVMVASGIADGMARKAAIEAAGGWKGVKAASDHSLNSLRDLALHLHLMHSSHHDFDAVVQSAAAFYPVLDLQVKAASKKVGF